MTTTATPDGDTAVIKNISDYFDHHGDAWKTPYKNEREAWHEYRPIKLREQYALELIKDEPKGTALDLGCGIGHALMNMKRAGFENVIGVDISPEMLKGAKRLLDAANLGSSVKLYSSDVRSLSMIPSRSVDACIALGVIEYLPDDSSLLKEINRVLKPGASAVVQTRNFYCLNTRTFKLAQRLIPRYRPRIFYREHKPPAFRSAIEHSGFRVERECFSHFFALYPLTSVPVVRGIVDPVNNVLSKQLERFRYSGASMLFAATYIVKFRKVSEADRNSAIG